MKVLEVEVDPRSRWANDPELKVTFDTVPPRSEARWEKFGEMYVALQDGFVRYYSYSGPGQGYGGSHFHITMIDETEVTLIGPWSSRAAGVNMLTPYEVMDIVYYDRSSSTPTLGMAGCALEIELAHEIIKLVPGWELRRADNPEHYWVPALIGQPLKSQDSRLYRGLPDKGVEMYVSGRG